MTTVCVNPFNPEFTIVIFKPQIAVAILDL